MIFLRKVVLIQQLVLVNSEPTENDWKCRINALCLTEGRRQQLQPTELMSSYSSATKFMSNDLEQWCIQWEYNVSHTCDLELPISHIKK